MSVIDTAVLAERTMAVERHLARVAARLPASPDDLRPASDASDAVVLHLWQATQIVIDLAMSACLVLRLGTPSSYADAFRRLERADVVGADLADRLVRAAGFRNLVAHAYESLDLKTGACGGNSWTGGPPALPGTPEGSSRDRRALTAPAAAEPGCRASMQTSAYPGS